jgi:hypothetical protein
MPIVFREGGFTFSFFANDHEPPHVHVRYAGTWCKVHLETLTIEDWGMRVTDQAEAGRIVLENREHLIAAWNTFHARKRGSR